MQHVTSLRMKRAAEILLAGESVIAAFAEAVGYSDAFAGSKIFKKWIGCAPANYREAPGKMAPSVKRRTD
jgi:two-component system response regulator YesN